MSERTLYAVFFRMRFPSGRVIRKYRSRDGRRTENLRCRWLTASREHAENMTLALSAGDGEEWHVAEIDETALLAHKGKQPVMPAFRPE